MIQKFKLFSIVGLTLTFCTIMVACGEPAANEEATQETPAPQEEPAEIIIVDTNTIVIDTTAEQRPINRR